MKILSDPLPGNVTTPKLGREHPVAKANLFSPMSTGAYEFLGIQIFSAWHLFSWD